ncbi:hypothetical protein SAMN05519104_4393 [Rhizobiales bacterium GAS188]|nr:hypothetical protein SAMN05519104_4393 [Rhizobiales bacterium GAS188]
MKELGLDVHELIDEHNVMNALRSLYALPHFQKLDHELAGDDDEAADDLAEMAGRRCAFNGGRTQDSPYAGDPGTPRAQAWMRGYNDSFGIAMQAGVAAATMRKQRE